MLTGFIILGVFGWLIYLGIKPRQVEEWRKYPKIRSGVERGIITRADAIMLVEGVRRGMISRERAGM